MTIKETVKWIQIHLGPINHLPSWANELLSGFLCVGLAWVLLVVIGWIIEANLRVLTFPLAFVLSEVYEHKYDPWGYNPQDVVERVRGIVVLMILSTIWITL